MTRILFAWELGGGYGHLARLSALSAALDQPDVETAYALYDLRLATRFLSSFGEAWYQAPVAQPGPPRPLPAGFAGLLDRTAFDDERAIRARAIAWRRIFAAVRPHVLVADHAPTALLAARGSEIATVVTGTGFTVPPDSDPLPILRTWMDFDAQEVRAEERRLLERMNRVLEQLGAPTLDSVASLYRSDATLLTSWPELDHHGARDEADYVGMAPAEPGTRPDWPEGDGRKLFAYLKPFEKLPALVDAMKRTGCSVLVHMAKIPEKLRARFQGGNLQFTEEPLDLDAVGQEADAAVLNGGHATTAHLISRGCPLLIAPLHLEQVLMGRRVEALGAGLSAPRLDPKAMQAKLGRVLDEKSFSEAAAAYAARRPADNQDTFESRVRDVMMPLLDRSGS